MKRIALSRFRLADGTLLRNRVLEFEGNHLLRHYQLTKELPTTIWIDEEWSELEADGKILFVH